MTKTQLLKILKTAIIMTVVVLCVEVLFSVPQINNWFYSIVVSANGVWVYVIIWLIMFLQTTILNIPAYIILSASVSIGIQTLSVLYVAVVLSAYMCGCLLAYLLGRVYGKKIVMWCAGTEEDYNKWSDVLNNKGKWWYLLTVLFPFFPDDILCLVAGAVKFDFKFYVLANLIGRGIGLVTMLLTLNLVNGLSGGFPFMVVVWALALIVEIIMFIVLKRRKDEFSSNRK